MASPCPIGPAAADIAWIANGNVLGVPIPLILLALIAAASWFVLRYTPFGRDVYAVGDNLEAARLAGISTNRTIFSVYVISGLCAAVAALIIVARLTAGEPRQGEGLELDAIAIVVIGGTSLFGGEGGVDRDPRRRGHRGGDEQPPQPPPCLAVLPGDREGPDDPGRSPPGTPGGPWRREVSH